MEKYSFEFNKKAILEYLSSEVSYHELASSQEINNFDIFYFSFNSTSF